MHVDVVTMDEIFNNWRLSRPPLEVLGSDEYKPYREAIFKRLRYYVEKVKPEEFPTTVRPRMEVEKENADKRRKETDWHEVQNSGGEPVNAPPKIMPWLAGDNG